MQRHWKGIQWFSIIVATLIIISFINGWLFLVYGIAAAALLMAFVYLIAVTRFDNRPSDEEEAHEEHMRKRAAKRGPGAMGHP